MTKKVENVCTEPAAIARIEALIANLPGNARVRLLMIDGSRCEGRVSVRPSVQTARDHAGVEGVNARVALELNDRASDERFIWLDQVERIEHLDTAMGGES